jgi:hypothetical protein
MRTARWFGGGILLAATTILTLISVKFLFHASAQAAGRGISITSPLGETIARVGFGGFPLASAIIAVTLLATGHIRRGLWFIVILFGTVLVVRVVSGATNGSLAASIQLIVPEVVFVGLSSITLFLGREREPRAMR